MSKSCYLCGDLDISVATLLLNIAVFAFILVFDWGILTCISLSTRVILAYALAAISIGRL